MKLNKPGIDLTGEYICVISTFADEQSASVSMVVYSTEDKFDLVYKKKIVDDKDGVEITCVAEGLYPQAILNIFIEDVLEKQTAKPTVAACRWTIRYLITNGLIGQRFAGSSYCQMLTWYTKGELQRF